MNWAARTVRLTEKRPLGDLPETRSRECRYGQIAISKPRFIGLFPQLQRLSKNLGKEALLRLKGLCSQLYATHTAVLFLTSMTR